MIDGVKGHTAIGDRCKVAWIKPRSALEIFSRVVSKVW